MCSTVSIVLNDPNLRALQDWQPLAGGSLVDWDGEGGLQGEPEGQEGSGDGPALQPTRCSVGRIGSDSEHSHRNGELLVNSIVGDTERRRRGEGIWEEKIPCPQWKVCP